MKKKLLYRSASYIWRNTLLKWYRGYKKNKKEKYWQEHKKCLGKENADKTFYIIRRRDWYCGLFSLFLTNLQRIDIALKSGYIPVVDMQSDFNIYLSEDKVGKENAWEYYFEQPCGYSLKDINRSKNVIIGSGAVPKMFPYLDISFLYGETGELEYWRNLVRDYVKVNNEVMERLESRYHELFPVNAKVLGVICRGTDYTNGKPKNHPVQPSVTQIICKVEEIMKEIECDKIFLATEDERYYNALKSRFNDKIITNTQKYIKYQSGAIGKLLYEDNNSNYENGMEYLITILLLSKCNYLCGSCVSGTVGALLLTKGFEYTYLFDLGIYE